MSYQLWRVVFKVQSPIHIGKRKVGNLMETRYYVPGRVMWGAMTAALGKKILQSNNVQKISDLFEQIGKYLNERVKIGYFFIAEKENSDYKVYYPKYKDCEVVYGNDKIPEYEFENRFISSYVSTSIDPNTHSAESGSLHEVEFIKNKYKIGKNVKGVYLVGYMILDTNNSEFIINNEKISINIAKSNNNKLEFKYNNEHKSINKLIIGGERSYGFGHIILDSFTDETKIFGQEFDKYSGSIEIKKKQPVPAHIKIKSSLSKDLYDRFDGEVEPFVVRNRYSKDDIEFLGLMLKPGTIILKKSIKFKIGKYGILEEQ